MAAATKPVSRRWPPVCLAVVLCVAASARAADSRAWDYTLPTLAGDRFVRASSVSGPMLINFWGCQCPPCIEELPHLQAFARSHPECTVLLVCTDAPGEARVFLERHHITLTALRAGVDVTGLMRVAGNGDGSLPFTVVLQGGRILGTHKGKLSEADLSDIASVWTTKAP